MNVLENKMKESIDEVISITMRDGNKKRPYLIMNKLQGKYIPIKAEKSLNMFNVLGEQCILEDYLSDVLVIGFAETATAIGAGVALNIQERYPNKSVMFMPTTREDYKGKNRIEFKEEHSHAVEQYLYCDVDYLKLFDAIIFAEDEITTGNTIMNFVRQLNELGYKPKRMVALSLLNCMDENELKRFEDNHIDVGYLIKTDRVGFEDYKTIYEGYTNEVKCFEDMSIRIKHIPYLVKNPRMGVRIKDYTRTCKVIIDYLKDCLNKNDRIICIGTEECIFPAMQLSDDLEKVGFQSVMQTSTRVPVCVKYNLVDNPISSKFAVDSLYGDRITYLYNLLTDSSEYDKAIVVTDGKKMIPTNFISSLNTVGIKEVIVVYL